MDTNAENKVDLLDEKLNTKIVSLSVVFIENYLYEGKKWLALVEKEGIEAGEINGHVAFMIREWLEMLDGVYILYQGHNIRATQAIIRSLWELFAQFRYFFADISDMEGKFKCYNIVKKYKTLALLKKYKEYALENNNAEIEKISIMLDDCQRKYDQADLFQNGEIYKTRIDKKKGNCDWYSIFNDRIRSIRGLCEITKFTNGKSLDSFGKIFYGQFSAYTHGMQFEERFYLKNGKMHFLPFHCAVDCSLGLILVKAMFDDILKTLENYYKGSIVFDEIVDYEMIKQQESILSEIKSLDALFDREI